MTGPRHDELIVTFGRHPFSWSTNWLASSHDGTSAGWAHHGVAVMQDGTVLLIAEDRPDLLAYDASGRLASRTPLPITEGHGLTLEDGPDPWLWVTDPGFKSRPVDGVYKRVDSDRGGGVVRCRPDGSEPVRLDLRKLETPLNPWRLGEIADPAPTDVTLDVDGKIWVADGYGSGLVIALDPISHEVVRVLDGTSGAGRFDQPHGVHGHGDHVLIADRRHARIQVFDPQGRYQDVVQLPASSRPSAFATWGEGVLVTDLTGSVWELNAALEPVSRWGAAPDRAHETPSWPNRSVDGTACRPLLREGEFRAPHSIATWRDQVFVTEWIIGGRVPRLRPAGSDSTGAAASDRTTDQLVGGHP